MVSSTTKVKIKVDLGVMEMKQYSRFAKVQEVEPHYQMQWSGLTYKQKFSRQGGVS